MKKVLLIMILAMSCNVAQSQALLMILFGDKLSTETFQVGINASASASNINGISDTKFRYSWAFGAFGEIRFSDTWYLHIDLTIKTPGGAKNVQPFMPFDPIVDSLFTGGRVDRSFNYITLPVMAKYRAGAWKFGLGGQLGYLTSATDVYTGSTILGDDFTMDRRVTDFFNRWDAGLAGTVEYFFMPEKKMRSMRISLKYYYGLTDVLKDNQGDAWTNSILLLSFGIPIGGSDEEEE
jgi:hypothetical protein